MLISPPFLVNHGNLSEDAWIDACMVGGTPGDGAFPIGNGLRWHGGMHLTAPATTGTQVQPVRAIADGTVVYQRAATTPKPTGAALTNHAQHYNRGWSDNGVVVIRHETEIGEGANARVTFFSIYMHLSAVSTTLRTGGAVNRKAVLGQAGQIDGQTNRQIHFEIICDEANLARLVGRATGDLPLTSNGRTDAVFGQMHFHLPVGTRFYTQQPLDNNATAMMQPPTPRGQPKPAAVALQAVHTSTEELFVAIKQSTGDAVLTTYRLAGTEVGGSVTDTHGEYDRYRNANTIARSFPEAVRPAASAVFELLRWGRVLNTANETLTPANVPHWRKACYSDGNAEGWVNLNNLEGNLTVHKFSDADFPHWLGWKLIDDTHDNDSRCNSPAIRSWLDADGNGRVTLAEATTRAATDEVQAKLKTTICKFPTEWNAATVDARWGWLKTQSDDNPEPMDNDSFERLRRHITALEFWTAANTGLPDNHWHFQPREFIKHLRSSRWLSDNLLSRLYPQANQATRDRYRTFLNRGMSKYSVTGSVKRMIHYLGQGAHESAQLGGMIERGNTAGSRQPEINAWFSDSRETYFDQYDGRNGNVEPNDGIKFRGRGMKQLTGRYNYGYYWAYRNWIVPSSLQEPWWNPTRLDRAPTVDNPQRAGNEPYTTIDAGSWYWESTPIRGLANGLGRRSSTVNVAIDAAAANADVVRSVCRTINGGEIGLPDRRIQTTRVTDILKDES